MEHAAGEELVGEGEGQRGRRWCVDRGHCVVDRCGHQGRGSGGVILQD